MPTVMRLSAVAQPANPDNPVAECAPWFYPWRFVEDKLRLAQTRTFTRDGGGVWTVESPRVMFDFLEMLEGAGHWHGGRSCPMIGAVAGDQAIAGVRLGSPVAHERKVRAPKSKVPGNAR